MPQTNVASVLFSLILATVVAAIPGTALAQNALSNGGTHVAVLQVGGLDTWTFTASKNDGIAVSLGKVLGSGSDSIFAPWIRLQAPDGSLVAQDLENGDATSAQLASRATLTGTYTVLVANRFSNQASPASYVITLAKTPGPYTVSPDDEGGPLTSGPHSGVLGVGDLDAWSIEAAMNDSIVVSLGKVKRSGEDDAIFAPWLRLLAPDGSLVAQDLENGDATSAQLESRATLAGTYTVLVANRFSNQASPASYVITLAKTP